MFFSNNFTKEFRNGSKRKNCDCYVNTTKNIFFWRSDFENV